MSEEKNKIKKAQIENKIVKQLQEVYDPEISVNIYDLGLIYDIQINEEKRNVEITHTLTSAFCPFADEIVNNIKNAGYVEGIDDVKVITTFDPPFTMNSVSEETRMAMGWF
jgi:metal-sulfur cluster biosynthetic enzyme